MDQYPEDDDDLFVLPDEPTPYWTARRVLLAIIIALMIITFLAYSFSGLFQPPPPPPTPIPGSLI